MLVNRIDDYNGKYRFLSNFWPDSDDTLEHKYQVRKTRDPEWIDKILNASTPGQAKKLGQLCPVVPEWDQVKVAEMYRLLVEKFDPGRLPLLAGWLIETGDALLVEGNYWCDQFWGVCEGSGRGRKCKGHKPAGANWLGRLQMLIRSELILRTASITPVQDRVFTA